MVEMESKAQVASGEAKKAPQAWDKALLIAREAENFKARDIVVLDVTGYSSFSDYFVICSGKSSRQVQGIADNLQSALKDRKIRPLGVEGSSEGQWILMDYGDVIVHVFYEPVRQFYDLESLWSEAKKMRFGETDSNDDDSEEDDDDL
ncbi:MAG: ribosome silencing factor [Acidobacteriota bacterium]